MTATRGRTALPTPPRDPVPLGPPPEQPTITVTPSDVPGYVVVIARLSTGEVVFDGLCLARYWARQQDIAMLAVEEEDARSRRSHLGVR